MIHNLFSKYERGFSPSMKKIIFWLFILFTTVVYAVDVQITEIQPFKVGNEEEWFEFSVQSDEVIDISQWRISNGKTVKSIGAVRDKLVIPEKTTLLTGSGFSADGLFLLPVEKTFFTWIRSPVSLKNTGGSLKILDQLGAVLSSVTYPKGKSGTRKQYAYSEVFNWDPLKERLYPLLFRKDVNPSFKHTKGFPNKKSPSFPADFKIVISEISPDREANKGGDFIELYVVQGDERINLKYLEVKHNGTPLYYFTDDFWVSPGQFLTIWVGKPLTGIVKNTAPYEVYSHKKEGLSAGSGTVELIAFSDTSYEKTVDFVCYKNKKLSQTEQKRVDKNTANWHSECFEIKDLIPNESIARKDLDIDSDTYEDFFRHFNGSPNSQNDMVNHVPKAIITVQGSGKTKGKPPFSVNLTGEQSTDLDGVKDIMQYQWELDDIVFSTQANPKLFKIEDIGLHTVKLTVTDHNGQTSTAQQIFEVIPTGGTSSGGSRKDAKTFIQNILTDSSKVKINPQQDDFFDDFIEQAPETFWASLEKPKEVVSSFDTPKKVTSEVQPNVKKTRKEQWIDKNIGWVFAEDMLEGLD